MTRCALSIKEITKEDAVRFIRTYHYSKLIPKLFRYFIGIFEHNYLLGVVDLGWGNAILANHPEDVL